MTDESALPKITIEPTPKGQQSHGREGVVTIRLASHPDVEITAHVNKVPYQKVAHYDAEGARYEAPLRGSETRMLSIHKLKAGRTTIDLRGDVYDPKAAALMLNDTIFEGGFQTEMELVGAIERLQGYLQLSGPEGYEAAYLAERQRLETGSKTPLSGLLGGLGISPASRGIELS